MDDEDRDEDDRVAGPGGAATEQFQRAALDAVHAARALLDAAESMIQDPAAVEAMVKTVTSVAKTASDAVAGFASSGADWSKAASGDDHPDDGFEHISVD